MSISSQRRGRLVGAAAAGLALLLVPAGFTSAQAATQPNPPSNLRVVTSPLPEPGDLTIAWNAPNSPDVVEYYIEIDSPNYYDQFYVDAEDGTTYEFEGLIPGAPAYIQVSAVSVDEEGEAPLSDPAVLRASTLGEGEKTSFFDTVGNTFAYQIAWLASTGITTGYDDGSFRPGQPVLREQIAAFLYRLSGTDYEAGSTPYFKDVPTTHRFYNEIQWMADEGLSTGYLNADQTRSFAPSQPVLREQFAAFVNRGVGDQYEHGSDPASFTDVPRSSVFFDDIEFLALTGITTGYLEPNGTLTFRPGQPVLREQMAAFLYRANSLYFGPIDLRTELGLVEGAPLDNNEG